jgi:hypothetical protein
VAQSRHNLAIVLEQLGRLDEALPLAEAAWKRRQADDIPSQLRAQTAFLLARLLWIIEGPARNRSRARALAEDAAASYARAGEAQAERLGEVERWLEQRVENSDQVRSPTVTVRESPKP